MEKARCYFPNLGKLLRSVYNEAVRKLLISLLGAVATCAAASVAPTNTPVSAVTTRNFRVTGPEAANNSIVATYAEEALAHPESAHSARLTGWTVRYDMFPPIRIDLAVDTNQPAQRVTRVQHMADGLLDQRIHVLNPGRADTEDFLEALSWLMLNRLAVQAQTHLMMPAPPHVPDWLAVGLAQNLFSQYALRNRQVVLQRWQAGHPIRLATVLGWRLLPEGRWADKAVCGVVVEWLFSYPERTALLGALLARAMAGQPITPDWLAKQIPAATDARGLEKQWDLWVLHWEDAIPNFGALTRRQTDALRELLKIDPSAYGGGGKSGRALLSPDYLIAHSKEIGIRSLAVQVSAAIQATGLGRPPEYLQVLDAYAAFFDTIADVPAHNWLVRLLHRPPNEKKLRSLLVAADAQLADLEKTLARRQSYMAEFQRKLQGGQPVPAVTNSPSAQPVAGHAQ